MPTKRLFIGCLLFGATIFSVTAADDYEDNSAIFQVPEQTQDTRYNSQLSEDVAQSVMNFAQNLAVAMDKNKFPNTQIFSPISIMSSLALLHMGAHGNTYNQLNKLFSNVDRSLNPAKIHEEFGWLLEDVMSDRNAKKRPRINSSWRSTPFNPNNLGKGGKNTPNEHTVRVANAMFVQNGYTLKQDYAYAAQSVYKSEVTPLDFRLQQQHAKDYINSWVRQNTMGKIPKVIENGPSRESVMIIASTLYFRGFWEQPFLGSGTAKANFYPDGPDSMPVKILMMSLGGVFPFYDSNEYNCRIIGLPYKGNQSTMYIIQPNDSTRLNLQKLQKTLTGEKINEMISKMERRTGVVAFPKFHVSNSINLRNALIQMGIDDIFVDGSADFSLIADPEQNTNEKVAAASSSAPTFSAVPVPVPYRPQPKQDMPMNFGEVMPSSMSPSLSTQKSQSPKIQGPLDRFNEMPFIFSRFGEPDNSTQQLSRVQLIQQRSLVINRVSYNRRNKRGVTYKVESEFSRDNQPLSLKHLILNKRITKTNPGKKLMRNRRQTESIPESAQSLQILDQMRSRSDLKKPQLFVSDILHKVDFNVNEQGTEAAAATVTYLNRAGTDVAFRCDTPFLVLLRHDPTKLPLFYGVINIPSS